jgi:PilZ domain
MPSKLAEELPVHSEKGRGVYRVVEWPEQRNRIRVQVHWPVTFSSPRLSDAVATTTQNLSSEGFYCFAQTALVPGELVACTIMVPSHQPHSPESALLWACRVRIVRVEPGKESGSYGVGCQIVDSQFLNGARRISRTLYKVPGERSEAPAT